MAKGSIFWNNERGKLGETIVSSSNGQKVTKSYSSKINNPKTMVQMESRIKMAECVKLYKQFKAARLPMYFEGSKNKPYTDFYKFNLCSMLLSTIADYKDNNKLAWGNTIQLTKGSIPSIRVTPPISSGWEEDGLDNSWFIWLGPFSDDFDFPLYPTWQDLKSWLISNGYQLGDIISVVFMFYDPIKFPSNPFGYQIMQTTVDWSNNNIVKWKYALPWRGDDIRTDILGAGYYYDSFGGMQILPTVKDHKFIEYQSQSLTVIISRQTKSRLLVSNSQFYPNAEMRELIANYNSDEFKQAALISWGAQMDDAILKGNISH